MQADTKHVIIALEKEITNQGITKVDVEKRYGGDIRACFSRIKREGADITFFKLACICQAIGLEVHITKGGEILV